MKKYFSYLYQTFLYTTLFIVTISNHNGLLAQGWQWQNPLPQGNTLSSIIYINDNNIWASVWGGGSLLKSTDDGENWEIVSLPERIYAEDVFFIDENIGWACGQVLQGGVSNIVLGTTDSGKSWKVRLVDSLGIFNSVVFANEKEGWVSGEGARIFHTNDGGETWELQSNFDGNILSMDLINNLHIWATHQGAIGLPLLFTKNGGKDWIADSSITWAYDASFLDTLNGWISGRNKIARTTDGGKTWEIQLDILSLEWTDIYMADTNYGCAITSSKIAVTTNGGDVWTIQENPVEHNLMGLSFRDRFNGIVVGQWGTIIKTIDGGNNWKNLTNRVTSEWLSDISFVNDSSGWIAGWNGTLLKTTNAGNKWNNLTTNITEDLNGLFFIDLNRGFAVGDKGTIIRTTDGGNSWSPIPSPLVSPWKSIEFNNYPIGWIIGGDAFSQCKLIKSSNGGLNWNEVSGIFFSSGTPEIQFTSEQTGWIMIGDLSSGGLQRLYKTSDGGENWELILANYSDTSYYSMHFISDDAGWISTFPSQIIFHTIDGGKNWARNSTPENFNSIFFIDSLIGWGVSLSAIYSTNDGGITWILQSSLLTGIEKLKFTNNKNGFVIGSVGKIIHTSTGGVTGIGELYDKKTLNKFIIHQNYPNPFNSETTISFELSKIPNKISIYVFDLLGRKIKKIKINSPVIGRNSVRWNGKNELEIPVSSGIYFYSISIDGNVHSNKMVLLR